MALPPFDAGAVQVREAVWLPAVAETAVGASGTPVGAIGVTGLDGADAGPVPAALEAVMLKTSVVPSARPVIVAVVPVTTITAAGAAGEMMTDYPVMALPPFEAGAVQFTFALRTPAVAATAVGAPGAVAGVGGAANSVLAPPQAESTSRRATAAERRRGSERFTAIS